MGCKETGHSHAWPTDGVLVIQRCEIRCNFCTGDKALKEWKYAWFLRRHVRAVHCKGGKGEKYDLDVSTQWKADQDKGGKKAAKKPKQIKLEDEGDDAGDFDEDEEEEGEVATEGSTSKGKSDSTPWVQQPLYGDCANQFPGMTGGFQHVNPRDLHFDQALAFGDEDVDTLVDHKKIKSLLNEEHILAFLAAHARKAPDTNERRARPVKVATDEDGTPINDESGDQGGVLDDNVLPSADVQRVLDSDLAAQQAAEFYGLDDNGDAVQHDNNNVGHDLNVDDRFYMSDFSEVSDSESFWDSDVPLAQMSSRANTYNIAKPVISEEVMHAMGGIEAVTEVLRNEGVGDAEMAFAFNHYARVLTLHDGAEVPQAQLVADADEHMEID